MSTAGSAEPQDEVAHAGRAWFRESAAAARARHDRGSWPGECGAVDA
ncbi:hypothetical protein HEP84_03800 [Streptomyces sp. RLB1-33]|nr:hypothetical protein [Streptomyces sp. RLB1-33]QIY68514.1 hypothetical protein HEP84_03800 [Streptomyces sp. RLB1-33]